MPRPSPIKKLRYQVEAALFSGLTLLCRILPARWLVAIGTGLGRLAHRVDVKRRQVANANLTLAYGDDLDEAERRRIVRGVYEHLGRFTLEYLLLLARDCRPYSRWIQMDGVEEMDQLLERHGGAVFVTAHIGHWELIGAAFSERFKPLHAVMKPMRNPILNERLVGLREKLGMPVVFQRNAVRSLMRLLKERQCVALLTDQNQKRRPMFVDFFGVPAATVATAAVLAVRFRLPMVTGFCWRVGPGPLEYHGRLNPPQMPDPDANPEDEVRRLTEIMNADIERAVRAHPEQWNWIHPRWRTRPPEGR